MLPYVILYTKDNTVTYSCLSAVYNNMSVVANITSTSLHGCISSVANIDQNNSITHSKTNFNKMNLC